MLYTMFGSFERFRCKGRLFPTGYFIGTTFFFNLHNRHHDRGH